MYPNPGEFPVKEYIVNLIRKDSQVDLNNYSNLLVGTQTRHLQNVNEMLMLVLKGCDLNCPNNSSFYPKQGILNIM